LAYDFIVSRNTNDDRYGVWRLDPEAPEVLSRVETSPEARFDRRHQLLGVGKYLLDLGPKQLGDYAPCYPYRLFEFDPDSSDPLSLKNSFQKGLWQKKKFWGSKPRYTSNAQEDEHIQLLPLTSFMLHVIPGPGRCTYALWNFDPRPTKPGDADPLPVRYAIEGTAPSLQESFSTIRDGHELIPIGDYVLDRMPDGSGYRLLSFDPQREVPLALPAVQQGRWTDIDASHRLVPVGQMVLDWVPATRAYRLFSFDPLNANPLGEVLRQGTLPAEFDAATTLMGVQPPIPVTTSARETFGTIDAMRARIKHVVYYMLESRSFDNVCGWLYEKGAEGITYVGKDAPFMGVTADMSNRNSKGKEVCVTKFQEGELSEGWVLAAPQHDPCHNFSDSLVQMFSNEAEGYPQRARPDMGGFLLSTADQAEVMQTLTPNQLPIFNGLARHFGVSDEWFASVPGGTTMNRAFSVAGSALDRLTGWEGGNVYEYWAKTPRRQSLWKVLWSNGITDWKIYNAVEWLKFRYTYHLFVEGQIPTVDADTDSFLADLEQFKKDARAGRLPAFSFLEPVWIAPSGTTSYHPGGSLVAGELALNEIYDALRAGPAWDQTLLIVTFDKHGGMFDHLAPPYARKPWPNDGNNGFDFDLMGPRVPTIAVSPWIKQQTVFRARGPVPFDATSFAATLLRWFGIPKARWGLGDRIDQAPTFEGIFLEDKPRRDAPTLTPPYDKLYPRKTV